MIIERSSRIPYFYVKRTPKEQSLHKSSSDCPALILQSQTTNTNIPPHLSRRYPKSTHFSGYPLNGYRTLGKHYLYKPEAGTGCNMLIERSIPISSTCLFIKLYEMPATYLSDCEWSVMALKSLKPNPSTPVVDTRKLFAIRYAY